MYKYSFLVKKSDLILKFHFLKYVYPYKKFNPKSENLGFFILRYKFFYN